MKRYNINFHNGWLFFLEVLGVVIIYATCICFTVLFLATYWIVGIVMLVLLISLIFAQSTTVINGLINCFYYDEKNKEIILKLNGRKKTHIPISFIGKISPKINENPKNGAITTISSRSDTKQMTFAVQDTKGNDLFYIKKDPMILGLFESLGVKIVYKEQ